MPRHRRLSMSSGFRVYGSERACAIASEIMNEITCTATEWSLDAGKERGACSAAGLKENREAFLRQCEFYFENAVNRLTPSDEDRWETICERVRDGEAYRASYVTCIAPTGNTGIAGDAGTSGMEPSMGFAFQRNTRTGVMHFADEELQIQHPEVTKEMLSVIAATKGSISLDFDFDDEWAVSQLQKTIGDKWKGEVEAFEDWRRALSDSDRQTFVMMHDIDWQKRINQQAAFQKFTSLAISSTINLPNKTTADEIYKLYKSAHSAGLKGITVYRDGSIQYAPISYSKDKDALKDTMPDDGATSTSKAVTEKITPQSAAGKKISAVNGNDTEYGNVVVRKRFRRPARTVGHTVEIVFNNGIQENKFYITVNEDADNPGHPIEVFIGGGIHGENAPSYNQALGRVISGWLKDGAPVRAIVKKLIGTRSEVKTRARIRVNEPPIEILSVPDAIAKILQREYLDNRTVLSVPGGSICPMCHHRTLVYAGQGKRCWECQNPDCTFGHCS